MRRGAPQAPQLGPQPPEPHVAGTRGNRYGGLQPALGSPTNPEEWVFPSGRDNTTALRFRGALALIAGTGCPSLDHLIARPAPAAPQGHPILGNGDCGPRERGSHTPDGTGRNKPVERVRRSQTSRACRGSHDPRAPEPGSGARGQVAAAVGKQTSSCRSCARLGSCAGAESLPSSERVMARRLSSTGPQQAHERGTAGERDGSRDCCAPRVSSSLRALG